MTSNTGSSNPTSQRIFSLIREYNTLTKQDLIDKSKYSERSVRTYLHELLEQNLIKEMPNYGRTKLYACIDYVPILDESKPLAQRWMVWSPAGNTRYTLGELATYYGQGTHASSIQAAELLLKAPAMLCYFAQENQMSDDELEEQLKALQIVLEEAKDQLQSAISVFGQLLSDPRYWRPDLLHMFVHSPDFPLPKEIPLIINRLTTEQQEVTENEQQ